MSDFKLHLESFDIHSEESVEDDYSGDILDWENKLDSAGPFASLSELRSLLNEAPQDAPSLKVLKDMINIRTRTERSN